MKGFPVNTCNRTHAITVKLIVKSVSSHMTDQCVTTFSHCVCVNLAQNEDENVDEFGVLLTQLETDEVC